MKVLGSLRTMLQAVLVAALSALLLAGLVGTASAAPSTEAPDASAGRSVPASKVSIQLWTFAEYIGLGSDADTRAVADLAAREFGGEVIDERPND